LRPEAELVVTDADVLMNLMASGVAIQILECQRIIFLVTPTIGAEALYLEALDPSGEREKIDLTLLQHAGLLQRVGLEGREFELSVSLARAVDDGEAEIIALAVNRGLTIATDDRKARRVAADYGVGLVSTPEIIRGWWSAMQPSDDRLSEAITLISRRSRYRPPTSYENYEWWISHLRVTGQG
jgi:predicted nucleic acid-binding protein